MFQSRRVFLGTAAGLAAATALNASGLPPAQTPEEGSAPGSPGTTHFGDTPRRNGVPFPDTRRDPDAELKDNQDHIRKDLARLSQLVGELQKGLSGGSGGDSTKVLSLDAIHKTEEIEKLARQIRDLIRG